jgi:3-hydroxyisobutyrate dehydrogenase-like beta-hydroxyacid dehydrogenase
MEVGFIGLGRMGRAMARNLLKAGHRVFVYNRTRTRAEELRDEGAEVADSPAGACTGDIVITMLADDDAVEEIVLRSGGLIRALRENAIHLSMSTITVGFSEVLTEAHYAAGQHFVAAPVFGRPEAAAAARLFIVAAGEAEPLDRCRPLFDDLGQKTFIVDRFPPKANLVKLSGNFLVASVIECLGEAVALIRKAGVDPAQFLAILTGSLFAAPCRCRGGAERFSTLPAVDLAQHRCAGVRRLAAGIQRRSPRERQKSRLLRARSLQLARVYESRDPIS